MRPHFLLFYCNRSPAPHFRPIRPPGIANYSQEISLNEPGALDERLRTLVMQSLEGGGERLRFIYCFIISHLLELVPYSLKAAINNKKKQNLLF